jgi:hypothetical protein
MVIIVVFCFCLTTLASLSTNIWLSKWTDQSKKETMSINETSSSIYKVHGLAIYSILGLCQGNKFEKLNFFFFKSQFFIIILIKMNFSSSIGVLRHISNV